MARHLLRLTGFSLAALLLWSSRGFAQAPQEGDLADLKTQIAQLQQSVESLAEATVTKEDLAGFVSESEFQERSDQVDKRIDALLETVSDQSAQIAQLRENFQKVTDNLAEQVGGQQDILEAISQPTADGSRVLALRSNMQRNPEFREEVQEAVNDSIRRTGTLEVQNNMDVGKYFEVNGRRWYIPARSTRSFDVPVGTLTTELVGDEPRRSLTIGPPDYFQRVEINPQQTMRTVERPVMQSSYEPVIVEPPTYYYPAIPTVVWEF